MAAIAASCSFVLSERRLAEPFFPVWCLRKLLLLERLQSEVTRRRTASLSEP